MFEFDNVTKLYGNVIGVNDITLSLPPGAYGLVGPNGSGKSTLLNLITGQLRPTLGRVRVFGENPVNNADMFSRLGYCPASEGMYSEVNALEWVTYLQRMGGMSAKAAHEASLTTLEMVGLKDAMKRPISTYSRGMRQRVKLAQAIAHNPEFLILDEPFSGLDPVGRNQMVVLLKGWIKTGKSLLLASHVLHEIESITSHFLLISGGRLLAVGNADDVQEIMVEVPNRITLRSSRPRDLAALLLRREIGESFTLEEDRLTVSTRNPMRMFQELPSGLLEEGIDVTEMHSADESLQSLFTSLLKIHRGEL